MVDEKSPQFSSEPHKTGALAAGQPRATPGRILCIGGAVVDTLYAARRPIEPGTSNPVSGLREFGGVARNVAVNLKRLGIEAALLSVIGDDDNGRLILRDLDALGIDATGIKVVAQRRTAEYIAVLEPDRNLHVGLADMEIFDLLSPDLLAGKAGTVAPDWIFADCNATPDLLATLLDRSWRGTARLALDAVSTAKAERLPGRLDGLDLLFLNRDEAAAILRHVSRSLSPDETVRHLLGLGVGEVVLTLGAEGLLVGGAGTPPCQIPARKTSVADVTGAGDALVAATLAGRLAGLPLADAARLGAAAASLTLERLGSTHPELSYTRVASLAGLAPTPRVFEGLS